MPSQSLTAIDEPFPIERSLESASSGLIRSAGELRAAAVAVLCFSRDHAESLFFWNYLGDQAPILLPGPEAGPWAGMKARSGVISASDPAAQHLSKALSPHLKSFLLFPGSANGYVLSVVFGFTSTEPPSGQISDAALERLNAAALAVWSAKEIVRLRAELRVVTRRLAGRKLVERAKGLLQANRGITEMDAYEHLRRLSRQQRAPLAVIAEQVVRESALQGSGIAS